MSRRIPEPALPALAIGQTFAGYRIDELAGRQRGMGKVYVATHLKSERQLEFPPWPVALKVFSPPPGQEAEFRARFEQAAKLQAGLHHPSVVSVYEVGSEPLPFMSMTLFRGPNLADLIASRELDEPSLLSIIEPVAAALDGGAEQGLVYRRLRPGGVLVATNGERAFLGDFGAGRATRITDLLEREELGTYVDYISPEEARGGDVTVAGNVYSLASIAFECLTGEPPYPRQDGEQSLQARLEQPARPLRALRPDLAAGLESVLARALESEPHRRPASAGQLATAIRGAFPKRRRRAGRLRAATTLAKTPPLPARRVPAKPPPVPMEPTVSAEPAVEEHPATPAVPRGRSRTARRSGRLLSPAIVLVALLVAGAAVLGALVAPGPKADVPRKAEELAAGPVNLRYPASWSRLDSAPRIQGVVLSEPAGLAPGSGDPAGSPARALVAGHIPMRQLPGRSDAEPVDLGAVQAYRYRDIKPTGRPGHANLYVVPTSSDAVVIGCLAPSTSEPFMRRCERVASTLRLANESNAVALAPSPAYAAGLRRIVKRLDAGRSSARRRLARARTRSGQAGNAARLSIAYRVARRSASRLTPPPGAREVHGRIVAALSRAGRAYRDMAAAAKARAKGKWSAGRRAAVSSERSLQQALNDLQKLGYRPQS